MAWSARVGGHPVHPMLVHFPITLWTGAGVADAGGWISGGPTWWRVSFACHVLGIVTALIAMVFGFLDYASLARQHLTQNTAVTHMLAMSTAWLFFLMSLALRGSSPATPPPVWATVAVVAALLAMGIGGWAGGQLVYGFGVGSRR